MIPFPTMHIAESVLNRIANALEGGGPLGAAPQPAPLVPNPQPLGMALDESLTAPVPPVAAPPGAAPSVEGAESESLVGGSPFDGALLG